MEDKIFKPEHITSVTLVSDPRVNPSECRVAYVQGRMDPGSNKYVYSIWSTSPEGKPEPLTRGPSDTCPKWSPSGRLLAFTSKRDKDSRGSELWVIGSREPWMVYKAEAGIMDYEWLGEERMIILSGHGKPNDHVHIIDHLPVWVNGEGFIYYVKQKLDLVELGGEPETIIEAGGDRWVNDIAVSPDGRYVLYTLSTRELEPFVSEIHLYDLMESRDVKLSEEYIVWSIGWTDKSGVAWFIGKDLEYAKKKGVSIAHSRLYTFNIGGEFTCLTCGYPYNISNSVNSDARGPRCGKPVEWSRGTAYFYLAVKGRVFLAKMKPGDTAPVLMYELEKGSVDGFSIGRECIYYTLMTHRSPAELYCYNPRTGVSKRLTRHNEAFLRKVWLGTHEHFTVKASDGEIIDAWIMKPRIMPADGKAPAVLYIHGGPKTMFGEGFMMDFHILASHGFAVIYSNPRGSDGYTEDFADIKGDYGGRDYADLMEVLESALERYEWIDPRSLGVTGGSYGGFMTNWIVTRTDKFKAAVTQRSCSDWISDFGTTDIGWYFTREALMERYDAATPWEEPEKYMERSPLWGVGNAATPMLIIHSLEDYRCHVGQAIELFTAYKLRGLDVRLALFPGENHDLSRIGKPKARIERVKLIVDWFDRYLKNKR